MRQFPPCLLLTLLVRLVVVVALLCASLSATAAAFVDGRGGAGLSPMSSSPPPTKRTKPSPPAPAAAALPATSTTTTTGAAMASAAATSAARRAVGKLRPETSTFLLCDIQERFRPLIHKTDTVVRTAKFLTSVAKTLDVPIVATQQYTKVFGPTVSDCFADPSDIGTDKVPVFEKKLFSMMTPEVRDYISKLPNGDGDGDGDDSQKRTSFILFGIEAHVCVQQTALDLLEHPQNDVHIIVDGVSSQRNFDRDVALRRMERAGAYLTTAQSCAFMLMGSAEHPNFKAVSKLVVENMKEPNEFHDDDGDDKKEE